MENNEFAKEHLNQNYWRHYRYSHDPFSATQGNTFFIPPTWEEYLDVLPQFARYCNSLLLITGTPGVGKSTLIDLFIKQNLTDYEVIFLSAADCPELNIYYNYCMKSLFLMTQTLFFPLASN